MHIMSFFTIKTKMRKEVIRNQSILFYFPNILQLYYVTSYNSNLIKRTRLKFNDYEWIFKDCSLSLIDLIVVIRFLEQFYNTY